MSFLLLPATAVAAGAAILGVLLWALQRLRVQHREIEVVSTLFWQAAVKETRARVFVRRFRHWPAWLLLFSIASLLWMLLANPSATSSDSREHIVLIDASATGAANGVQLVESAKQLARKLPRQSRSVLMTGNSISTLVSPGESVELADFRWDQTKSIPPSNLHWSLEQIASRSTSEKPLTIHLLGRSSLASQLIEQLPESVSVIGVPFPEQSVDSQAETPSLIAFGYSDASSNNWSQVDVSLDLQATRSITPAELSLRFENSDATLPLQRLADNSFLASSLQADGRNLFLSFGDLEIAKLSLPNRKAIRVQIDAATPASVIQFLADSPEFSVVESDAEVRIGDNPNADFCFTDNASPAFTIATMSTSPMSSTLIDQLAINQIDATSLATQAQQPITLDFVEGGSRKVSVWKPLLGPQFNFAESRAFPIFLGQSIRWLASRPSEVHSLALGDQHPMASEAPTRVNDSTLVLSDGRTLEASRISRATGDVETLSEASESTWFRFGPFTWMGILAASLLTVEWVLYQRGKLP
ncbi:MAG: hypothetical protein ACE361_24850 [Aureliella sp.]